PQGDFLEDVTGDGILDIVATSIGATVKNKRNAGAAFVWAGGPALAGSVRPTATLVSPTPHTDDRLGERPGAVFFDVDGDGITDVLLGSGYDLFSTYGAGNIFFWRGGSGLTGTAPPDATIDKFTLMAHPDGPDIWGFSSRGIDFADLTGDGR